MRKAIAIAALVAGAGAVAAAPSLAPGTVLLENGPNKITAADFEASMTRFPEYLREEARANPETIMKMIDALFVNRVLAERAAKAGIADDPLVKQRLEQLKEGYLAQKYLEHVEKQYKPPNLEARARDLYKADPKRFTEPATATVSHIVVGLGGRTPEMARQRAAEAHAKLASGAPFGEVAVQYSDDPNVKTHRGELGALRLADLDPDMGPRVFALREGELSEPIVTRRGVHVVRVTARKPERQRTFDEVKASIIEEEADKLRKRATEDVLREIRNSASNVIYPERVQALKSDIDPKLINRAHREAIEKVEIQR